MLSRMAMKRIKVVGDGLERHHILPRCLGGSKAKSNLVLLTYREHFIAHWLLVKMTDGKIKAKMSFALIQMCRINGQHSRRIASWRFEVAKRNASKSAAGKNGSFFGRKLGKEAKQKLSEGMTGERNHRYGKKPWNYGMKGHMSWSPEQRQVISERSKGLILSAETRRTMNAGKIGVPKSPEHRRKLSEALKGRVVPPERVEMSALKTRGVPHPIVTCPECGVAGGRVAMIRWHFDNCKSKSA